MMRLRVPASLLFPALMAPALWPHAADGTTASPTWTPVPTATPTPLTTWSNVGPAGNRIYALAIDPATPTTLYAAGGLIYKSTDGGGSWLATNTGMPGLSLNALAIDPQHPLTRYLGTVRGVFKSIDGGRFWRAVNTGLVSVAPINAFVVDPQTPTTLYAAGQLGVFKSTDGAESWQPTLGDPLNDTADDPRPTPGLIFCCALMLWYRTARRKTGQAARREFDEILR